MGIFYKTPSDLVHLETLVGAAGQEMALVPRGYANPDVLNDLTSLAAEEAAIQRGRLIAEGREKDLKAFRKHLLYVGGYMDNGPFNQLYAPFVRDHLGS
jgi:hypothetical protein